MKVRQSEMSIEHIILYQTSYM